MTGALVNLPAWVVVVAWVVLAPCAVYEYAIKPMREEKRRSE